LIMKKY